MAQAFLHYKEAHCEECNDRDYVPPSIEALRALAAGLESAKCELSVRSTEDFTRFLSDDDE